MKSKIVKIVAILLLSACSGSLTESEEVEYQNFVAASKAAIKESNLTPNERVALQEQAYKDSGLQGFIFDGQDKSVQDLTSFYNNVILGNYSGHAAQDNLKVRFIQYAVQSLDLTNPENDQETQFLTKMSAELMAVNQTINPQLIEECLSACKGKIGKDEFYQMVKKGRFQIRMSIDESNEILSKREPSSPKEPYEQMQQSIMMWEQTLANLNALTKE
jgi:hypothetical protein